MKKGDSVYTPRFCTVQIEEVYSDKQSALRNGYTEPTHYVDSEYGILGKSLDMYHMSFVAYKK